MTVQREEARREVTRNFEVFREKLPKLLNRDKWALLHHAELIAIFDTYEDAGQATGRLYPDDVYSMQDITDQIVDLGWFSLAPVFAHTLRVPTFDSSSLGVDVLIGPDILSNGTFIMDNASFFTFTWRLPLNRNCPS